MNLKCEICGVDPQKRVPYAGLPGRPKQTRVLVLIRRCQGCDDRHLVCGPCAVALEVLVKPDAMGAFQYCPDAAQLARELMGRRR